MKPISTLLKKMEKVLLPEGFARENGPTGFIKETKEGKCYVYVYHFPYAYSCGIDAGVKGSDSNRQMSLEDFEGLREYYFGENGEHIESATDLAVKHLKKYGIPWLRGEKVETEHLKKEKANQLEFDFNRFIKEARDNFKKRNYKEMFRFYKKAEEIKEIENKLDLKYIKYAKKQQKDLD
jgi:hypothetical protein